MHFAKIYLIFVALLYLALAVWCSLSPKTTSNKVGFELIGGTGKSEFLTVYGGLEFGIAVALAFFVTFRSRNIYDGVMLCVILHASLVLFRSWSLFAFSGISAFTYRLAIGEWVIFLVGLLILWVHRKASLIP